MRRIVCFLAIMLTVGIYGGYYLGDKMILAGLFFLVIAALKALIAKRKSNFVYPVAAFVLLFASVLIINHGDVSKKALYPYMDEYVNVTFEIASRPEKKEDKTSFYADIRELNFLNDTVFPSESVRLTVREDGTDLAFGDVVFARVRMNLPTEANNEGGFDYQLYMKTKGVFFTGYVDKGSLSVIGKKNFGFFDYMQVFNHRLCDSFDRLLTKDTSALMKGILLGDKSDMTEEMRTTFSRSGLSHIVAVSGMHIGTLLTVLFALYRTLRLKRFRMGLISIAAVIFYVCLTGAPVSAVRAGVMAIVAILAEGSFHKQDTYTSLAVTASVLILMEPFVVFDVSFMLSCGAVFGIFLYQKPMEEFILRLFKIPNLRNSVARRLLYRLISLLTTSISAVLLTVPVILFFFQETSLWGLLSNLIVLPLLPVLMAAGLLAGALSVLWEPLALLPSGASYLFLLIINYTAQFFARLQFGRVIYGVITPFFAYCYALFLFALFHILQKKPSLKACTISVSGILLLIAISMLSGLWESDIAKVRFINVGQGDSCAISLPKNNDILIDGAGTPAHQDYYDIGGKVIRPYLLQQGINDIEYVFATHGHEDHVAGLVSIIHEMPVGRLFVPIGFGTTDVAKALLQAAAEKDIPITELSAGDTVTISAEAEIEVLMPDREWAEQLSAEDENSRSLVLRFRYGETDILFTGDLSSEAEQHLVNECEGILQSEILKVAHHGARDATSQEFLDVVSPQYAFIPVGKNNYGHPNGAVLDRLYASGTQVYRADVDKDVIFTLNLSEILSVQ